MNGPKMSAATLLKTFDLVPRLAAIPLMRAEEPWQKLLLTQLHQSIRYLQTGWIQGP